MGAVINEPLEGIVAGVPFVDVVTTMLDDDIPLTTFEYDEWGNPNNKESYDYMLSYSPYDQVERKITLQSSLLPDTTILRYSILNLQNGLQN